MVVLASQITMVTATFYFIGVNKFNKKIFFFNVKMDIKN